MKRTSVTHPLQIAEVQSKAEQGRIGVTLCPGKTDQWAMTGDWERDLGLDLDAVQKWGAAAVITLVEAKELTLLRVENLGAEVARRGMLWFHLPIVDVSTPTAEFEKRWSEVRAQLLGMIRDGQNVLVHCRGGLGRAGMIAARLLVELGMDPTDAIARVRTVRPGAIETIEQERYVARQAPAP